MIIMGIDPGTARVGWAIVEVSGGTIHALAFGWVLLAAAQQRIPVVSYSPRAVKRAIAGDGTADKAQVTRMVVRLLHLDTPPKPDDTADALAIALTHAYSYKLKEKIA
ncbi:crossover junction endodeoxyribonuclease RuvC [Candidatus Gottesmanbacteria bacterium]|nr:crossover junction endodeoxyribonuclease RuvC [Candidatus Gottesmanbacteria bacterium]